MSTITKPMNGIRTFRAALRAQSIIFTSSLMLAPQLPLQQSAKRTFGMTTQRSGEPRRFAPLKEGADMEVEGVPKLKGVVFDMDGTLCIPQNYMFTEMRSVLGISKSIDILDHVYSLPVSQQSEAMVKLRTIESTAMSSQQAQPGLVSLMSYLESKNIPKGICTRNFETPVNHLLGKFLEGMRFEPIVTRDFRPPKPSPEGILFIARTWGLVRDTGSSGGRGKEEDNTVGDASQLIMVGDSIDDMTAGYRAGAATVLLVNEVNAHLAEHEHTDLCISRLDELVEVLERGFVGRIGRGEEEGDTKGRAEDVLREGVGESALK